VYWNFKGAQPFALPQPVRAAPAEQERQVVVGCVGSVCVGGHCSGTYAEQLSAAASGTAAVTRDCPAFRNRLRQHGRSTLLGAPRLSSHLQRGARGRAPVGARAEPEAGHALLSRQANQRCADSRSAQCPYAHGLATELRGLGTLLVLQRRDRGLYKGLTM